LQPTPGWLVVGGTSVAAPLIAGTYGLAGNAATAGTPKHIYNRAGHLYDVTSGSNGYCGSPKNYLCNAKPGYDAPTGLGSPDGTGAF
jgi:subtilase family serine protease